MEAIDLVAHGYFRHAVIARNKEDGMIEVLSFRKCGEKIPKGLIRVQDTGVLILIIPMVLHFLFRKSKLFHTLLKAMAVFCRIVEQERAMRRDREDDAELRRIVVLRPGIQPASEKRLIVIA